MIRLAKTEDLNNITDVYSYARKFMAENGNPTQWGTNYPSEQLIENDINNKKMYVIEEGNQIHAVFMFDICEDETYEVIKNGQWLSDEEYGVIHRVASDGKIKGVLNKAVDFCSAKKAHLRIDTHKDNKIMQHQIEKNGFKKCGIIELLNGDERIAYEKI
jgi:hypothetical protein